MSTAGIRFELASSAYLFSGSATWSNLGSTVILNPLLTTDGEYHNVQVASQPPGQAAVVLSGHSEGFGTIGANTFSPIAWDAAERLAAPCPWRESSDPSIQPCARTGARPHGGRLVQGGRAGWVRLAL